MANPSNPWQGKMPSFDDLPYYTPPSKQPVYVRRPKGQVEDWEPEVPELPDQRLVERQQVLQAIFGNASPAVYNAIEGLSSPTGSKVVGVVALTLGTVLLTKLP
jgi:hypothetical protein